jgi:hypothetical protein
MKAARRAVACVTAAAVAAAAADAVADAAADLASCMGEVDPDLDIDLLDALVEHDPVDDIKSLVISDPAVGWFVCIARHKQEHDRFAIFEHARFLSFPQAGARHAQAVEPSPSPVQINHAELQPGRTQETTTGPESGAAAELEVGANAMRLQCARRRLRGGDSEDTSFLSAPGYLYAAEMGAKPGAYTPVRWGYAVAHADHGFIRACFWWHNADGSVREVVTSDPIEAIKDEILLRIRAALSASGVSPV